MEKRLRAIETNMAVPNVEYGSRGYFHRWCDQPVFDSALNYPLSKTFALIEFVDGSVKFMEPEAIKFTEPYDPRKGLAI
jgi:hypothetical protein